MTTKAQDNMLTTVWVDEFVNHNEGVCSLCGNTGFLDTRAVAKSPRGAPCGRINFCICPNGRVAKKQKPVGVDAEGCYNTANEWKGTREKLIAEGKWPADKP